MQSDLDIAAYWSTLHAGGINRERLLSYDRAIRNEPDFSKGQVPGLLHDLRNYLHTLKVWLCPCLPTSPTELASNGSTGCNPASTVQFPVAGSTLRR